MTKRVLVAGPAFPRTPAHALNLREAINRNLPYVLGVGGIVLAEDTVTGQIAREWAARHGVSFCAHRAFDVAANELQIHVAYSGLWSDRMREMVRQRNQRMIEEKAVTRALLFVGTNECTDFITGLREPPRNVEIIRVA